MSQRDWINHPTLLVGGAGQPLFQIGVAGETIEPTTILDGFVLRSGYRWGAVINQSGAATIRNCTFESCAGWAINNNRYGGTISNCAFINGQFSAIHNSTSTPRISGCSFLNNVEPNNNGGAIEEFASRPVVTDCLFSNNVASAGGAIYSRDGGFTLERCVFLANRSSAIKIESAAGLGYLIRNCLFEGNVNWRGAAIANNDWTLRVINCTFVGNQSGAGGGAIDHQAWGGLVANSIFWGNSASQAAAYGLQDEQAQIINYGSLTISNSCIQGLGQYRYAGNGNLGLDPVFVAPGSDYHLSVTSPVLGGGNPGLLAGATSDLDGNPRTRSGGPGSGLDLGAYQCQEPASALVALFSVPQPVSACLLTTPTVSFSASARSDLSGSVWLVDAAAAGCRRPMRFCSPMWFKVGRPISRP